MLEHIPLLVFLALSFSDVSVSMLAFPALQLTMVLAVIVGFWAMIP